MDLAMNIYPGDLLVQEHHKKLIKRNTIADFYAGRSPSEGPGVPPSDGTGASCLLFRGAGGGGVVVGSRGWESGRFHVQTIDPLNID